MGKWVKGGCRRIVGIGKVKGHLVTKGCDSASERLKATCKFGGKGVFGITGSV